MKKILSLLMFLSLCFLGFSQDFHGGVLIGLTGSQIDGDSYGGYNKLGFQAGGFVQRQFTQRIGMQMELKYIGKGATRKTTMDDPSIYNVSLNYIELPLLFEFRISQLFGAETGVAASYLFASSNNLGLGDEAPDPPFKKVDFPFNLGGYYFFNEHFSLNVKYSYSLVPIRGVRYSEGTFRSGGQFNHQLNIAIYYKIK